MAALGLRTLALLLPLLPWLRPRTGRGSSIPQAGKLDFVSTVPRTHHVLVSDWLAEHDGANRTDGPHALRTVRSPGRGTDQERQRGRRYSSFYLGGNAANDRARPVQRSQAVLKELSKLKPTHAAATRLRRFQRSDSRWPRRRAPIRAGKSLFTTCSVSGGRAPCRHPDTSDGRSVDADSQGKEGKGAAEVVIVDVAKATWTTRHRGPDARRPAPLVDAPGFVTATVQNHGRTNAGSCGSKLLLGRPSASGADNPRLRGNPPPSTRCPWAADRR